MADFDAVGEIGEGENQRNGVMMIWEKLVIHCSHDYGGGGGGVPPAVFAVSAGHAELVVTSTLLASRMFGIPKLQNWSEDIKMSADVW